MAIQTIEALKGKVFKTGTYVMLKDLMDEMLRKGKSTTIFDRNQSIITSAVVHWELHDTWGIIITQNSAYHVELR